MCEDRKKEKACTFASALAEQIGNFRPFDSDFSPLSDDIRQTMFRRERRDGWPVLKRAIFIMNRDGQVMLFYRPPETGRIETNVSAKDIKANTTYNLIAYNSIVVSGDAMLDFESIAAEKICGWPQQTKPMLAGMSSAIVSGYRYFFEVAYAVVDKNLSFTVNDRHTNFVSLQQAIELMRSHGLESKEMEIRIAKALCKK